MQREHRRAAARAAPARSAAGAGRRPPPRSARRPRGRPGEPAQQAERTPGAAVPELRRRQPRSTRTGPPTSEAMPGRRIRPGEHGDALRSGPARVRAEQPADVGLRPPTRPGASVSRLKATCRRRSLRCRGAADGDHAVPQRGRHDRRRARQRARPGVPGLEHIVVDGGSTDGTVELLRARRGHPLDLRARPRARPRAQQGHRDGERRRRSASSTPTTSTSRARWPRSPRRSTSARTRMWLTGLCRIIDGDGREIRQRHHALQERAAAPLLAGLYLTHNFISAPGHVLPARGAGGGRRLRRALPHLRRLRPAAADRPPPRPDRARPLPRRASAWSRARCRCPASAPSSASTPSRRAATAAAIRAAVALNQLLSGGIVGAYEAMRRVREVRSRAAA